MYVRDHDINAYVSSVHEEGQVKAGKVKPGESILHLKDRGCSASRVVTCRIGA